MSARSTRTPDGDAKFFAALENGYPVRGACEAAGYARRCVYRWRKEDPEFAAAWAEAMAIAGDLLEEEADRRGRDGYDEPVYYQGEERGAKRRYSDALLLARLTVRVLNGMGGKAGTNETVMEDLIRRDGSDPMDASPPLRSGDFDVFPASDYDTDGQITIVQDGPLPLDILCVMPRVTVGEG